MSIKKIFAAGLSVSLLLAGMVQADTVYAAAPTLFASSDTASVSEGDYVNIDVELGNNPDISTLGAALNYDSNVLKYDSSTWNSSFSGSDMQMASDTGSEVNLSVVCDESYAQDGTVVSVRFQALQDAESIPVSLSLRDMADASLTEVSDVTVAGSVRVPETGSAPEQNPSEPENTPDDTDMVDLDNPEEASDISIVDEQADPQGQQETDVSNTAGSTGSESGVSGSMAQGTSSAGSSPKAAAVQSAKSSRPDSNYKTGIGLGSDALLVGAAVCGILALVLVLRRRKGEE